MVKHKLMKREIIHKKSVPPTKVKPMLPKTKQANSKISNDIWAFDDDLLPATEVAFDPV